MSDKSGGDPSPPAKLFIKGELVKFKSGMLGVCIVVIALLGTVASGFLLNVDKSQREVTTFDYVTDVTGLFDIQNAPEYVDYNPNTNYVGYTPSTAIDYSPTSKVNNYRYIVQEGTTYNTTYTVAYADSYQRNTEFLPAESGSSAFINWTGSYDFGSTVTNRGVEYNSISAGEQVTIGDVMGSAPMITTLSKVINAVGIGSYQSAVITISYGTMPVLFYHGDWVFNDVDREDDTTQYDYSATMDDASALPTKFEINLTTLTVKAYRNDTLLYNDSANNVDVIWRYSTRASGSFSPATDSSATLTVTAQNFPTYGYMDPTKGVSMDSLGPESVYTISADTNYTPMTGLFTPPDIPYPDTIDTTSWTLGFYNGRANSLGMLNTSFWNDLSYNIGLGFYYNNNAMNTVTVTNTANNRPVPDVASLRDWLTHIVDSRYGTTLADYTTIDISITMTGTLPVVLIPKSALTVMTQGLNQLYLYNGSTSITDLSIDCTNGIASASFNVTQRWTEDIDDVIVVTAYQNSTYQDQTGAKSVWDLTLTGVPGANTGPSYPILYIDNTDEYGGNWTDYLTINGQDVNTAVWVNTSTRELSLTSLDSIMAGWSLNGATEYHIDLAHNDYPVYMGPSAIWSYLGVGDYSQPWAKYYYNAGTGTPYTVIERLVYDADAGLVSAYTDDTLRWTADPSDVWVAYRYVLLDGSSDVPSIYQTSYAPVSTEVTITPIIGGEATWSNGYKNDTINITVQRFDLNGNNLTITAGASFVTVNIDTSGKITVTDGATTLNIGKWRGIQLTINATDGSLGVTPSNNLSFTSSIATGNTTQYIYDWYNGGTIEELEFSTTYQSPYWQITGTSVFLDTFNSVMNNPSITITDYFPEYEEWRLNFYSFAVYGDAITINNVPMSVNRSNGTVSFDIGNKSYTKPLNNIYVTKSEVGGTNHTQLTFVNDKATYDLGETTTDKISFDGLWYFTTGLYEASTGVESYYDWNLDSAWHNSPAQSMVIFLGLILFGCLGAKGLFRFNIKSLDGVVVIMSAIIILMYFGGSA